MLPHRYAESDPSGRAGKLGCETLPGDCGGGRGQAPVLAAVSLHCRTRRPWRSCVALVAQTGNVASTGRKVDALTLRLQLEGWAGGEICEVILEPQFCLLLPCQPPGYCPSLGRQSQPRKGCGRESGQTSTPVPLARRQSHGLTWLPGELGTESWAPSVGGMAGGRRSTAPPTFLVGLLSSTSLAWAGHVSYGGAVASVGSWTDRERQPGVQDLNILGS